MAWHGACQQERPAAGELGPARAKQVTLSHTELGSGRLAAQCPTGFCRWVVELMPKPLRPPQLQLPNKKVL